MAKHCLLFVLLTAFLFSLPVYAVDQTKYGSLKVVSENENAEIYVDGALAGYKIVTIEEIPVGSHYILIKLDGQKVFDKMFLIQRDQQTTIVYTEEDKTKKVIEQKEKTTTEMASKLEVYLPLNIFITYGTYNVTVSSGGQSVSDSASSSFTGFGLGIKNILKSNKDLLNTQTNYYYLGSFNYNTKVAGTQLSYISFDIGGDNNQAIFGEIGLNYPLWSVDGLSVSGNIGYQAAFGFNLTDYIGIGIKYAVFNGSFSASGYNFTVNYSQPMAIVSIHF